MLPLFTVNLVISIKLSFLSNISYLNILANICVYSFSPLGYRELKYTSVPCCDTDRGAFKVKLIIHLEIKS